LIGFPSFVFPLFFFFSSCVPNRGALGTSPSHTENV